MSRRAAPQKHRALPRGIRRWRDAGPALSALDDLSDPARTTVPPTRAGVEPRSTSIACCRWSFARSTKRVPHVATRQTNDDRRRRRPAIFNAANEVAVAAFLAGRLPFLQFINCRSGFTGVQSSRPCLLDDSTGGRRRCAAHRHKTFAFLLLTSASHRLSSLVTFVPAAVIRHVN